MKKLSLIITLLSFTFLSAQSPDTLWTKTYGGIDWEIGYEVLETSDGGYIIAGLTNSFGAGANDIYLIKTNANGDTIWTRTYGSPGNESAYSVFETSDGGYVIAGKKTEAGQSYSDAYIIKTNSSGDTLWTRTYGNGNTDEINSIIQTEGDDYYIMLGNTRSFGPGNSSIYFLEVSPAADSVWEDYFGGNANDYGQEIIETNDGYVFIGSSANFGAGSFDAWIVSIDWDYNILWSQTIGGDQSDDGYSIQQTTNNDFIGAGRTSSFGPGDFSFLIFRLNSIGDSLWVKVYGGTERDECKSIRQSNDGGFIAAGSTNSFGSGNRDWYIVRTDANGDSIWTKTLGGVTDDECHSVIPTSDGGYILSGSTKSFGAGGADVWLVKLAPDPTSINEKHTVTNFSLSQNYPNPFNPTTKISFTIAESGFTSLKVYDVLGNEVANLISEEKPAGEYEFDFNGSDLTSGIYFYQLKTGNYIETKKMVLIK
ncbi:MAG: T9SS type A sorting domain-containing protein [Ignavibacteriaceae bacterium]|nr:T9SS type A sorting domain-containing protein [Ignavibacteriaceae bacterium]